MKRCKKCGTLIEDKAKSCSVCGQQVAIEKGKPDNITATINPHEIKDHGGVTFKKKQTLMLYCFLLGFAGAGWFYLKKIWQGIANLIIALAISVGLLAFGLSFRSDLPPLYYIVLTFIPLISFNIGIGIYFALSGPTTDREGLPLQ